MHNYVQSNFVIEISLPTKIMGGNFDVTHGPQMIISSLLQSANIKLQKFSHISGSF